LNRRGALAVTQSPWLALDLYFFRNRISQNFLRLLSSDMNRNSNLGEKAVS